jgi:hypothetical protein
MEHVSFVSDSPKLTDLVHQHLLADRAEKQLLAIEAIRVHVYLGYRMYHSSHLWDEATLSGLTTVPNITDVEIYAHRATLSGTQLRSRMTRIRTYMQYWKSEAVVTAHAARKCTLDRDGQWDN